VIHSISNRTSHAIAIIGCTGLCYLFIPELSAGSAHTGALGSLSRQEEKEMVIKTYKNWKKIKPASENKGENKEENREKRLCQGC